MVAQAGRGQQSQNTGEISEEFAGRVDVKQFYSAGLAFKNVEPVPQGGFRALNGTERIMPVGSAFPPRYFRLKKSRTETLVLALLPGWMDVFRGTAHIARIGLPIDQNVYREASIFTNKDTIGIFHESLRSLRILHHPDDSFSVDHWPYDRLPRHDYGGDYPRTNDVWKLFVRWITEPNTDIVLMLKVNDEQIEAQQLEAAVQTATDDDWNRLAIQVQTQLQQLPSLGPNVRVEVGSAYHLGRELIVTFFGDLSGSEYDLTAQILNTSDASILASHTGIGRTLAEPLLSDVRGWPARAAIYQDRLIYAGFRSRTTGFALSRIGEYFDINSEAAGPQAAILGALSTDAAETILAIGDERFLLLFTDEAEYFATNRSINRDDPLNFVKTSENKIVPNTVPFSIENRLYYVCQRGDMLVSSAYDDIASAFDWQAESLLSAHLIDDVIETAVQRGTNEHDATRLWMLRRDGRLVCASIVRSQDIAGFFEYRAGAPVRSIGVDGDNRLWMSVERHGGLVHEIMSASSFLHGSVPVAADLAGRIAGLPFAPGSIVFAELNGYSLGPFTVAAGGVIDTNFPGAAGRVGPWSPPYWESVPQILIQRDDTIVRRPGRIHTANIRVLRTTSIAVGANGTRPRNVSLLKTSDPVDAPMPPKSELVVVAGIPGTVMDTTLVISQTRPGPLTVRDITLETKL